MPFNIGGSPLQRAYVGDQTVNAIYLGANKIWPPLMNYYNDFSSSDLSMFFPVQLTDGTPSGPAYTSGGILYPPPPPTTSGTAAQTIMQYRTKASTDHHATRVRIFDDAESTVNFIGVSVRGERDNKNAVLALASNNAANCGIWTMLDGTFTRRVAFSNTVFTNPGENMILEAIGNTYYVRKISTTGVLTTVTQWVDNTGLYPATPARRFGGVLLVSYRDGSSILNGPRADEFYFYDLDVTPAISGITPSSSNYVGGATVNITGGGFVDNVRVKIGDNFVPSVNVLSPYELTFTLPAGTVGTYPLTVVTNNGTSNAVNFTYSAGLVHAQTFPRTADGYWSGFFTNTGSSAGAREAAGGAGTVALSGTFSTLSTNTFQVFSKSVATDNQYLEVTLRNPVNGTLDTGGSGSPLYLRVRGSGPGWAEGTGLEIMIRANGGMSLSTYSGATVTSRQAVNVGSTAYNAGDTLRVEAVGNYFSVTNKNTGNMLISWTDTGNLVGSGKWAGMTQTANKPAFQSHFSCYSISSWEYGDL